MKWKANFYWIKILKKFKIICIFNKQFANIKDRKYIDNNKDEEKDERPFPQSTKLDIVKVYPPRYKEKYL